MSKKLDFYKLKRSRENGNKNMFDETKTRESCAENLEVPTEETPVKEESEIPVDELADDLA